MTLHWPAELAGSPTYTNLWGQGCRQLMRETTENQARPHSQQNTLRLFQANHKSGQKISTHGMKKKFIMSGCLYSVSLASVKVAAEEKLPAEAPYLFFPEHRPAHCRENHHQLL